MYGMHNKNIQQYTKMNPFYCEDEDEDEDFQQPTVNKKRRILSTEYSYKSSSSGFYDYDIDKFLMLGSSINHDPWFNHEIIEKVPSKQDLVRIRNRMNAQKSRDRKKNQFEKISSQMKELELENKILKQKNTYCPHCKARLSRYQDKKQHGTMILPIELKKKKNSIMDMQFQKPQLCQKDAKKNRKIWIAIAIVMMIMGIQIHGVNNNPIAIKLKKSTIMNFKQRLKDQSPTMKLPLNIEQKVQGQQYINQNKILNINLGNLNIKEVGDDQDLQEQMIEINKDLIFKLKAQIDDLGRYI